MVAGLPLPDTPAMPDQTPAEQQLARLLVDSLNLEGVDPAGIDPEAPLGQEDRLLAVWMSHLVPQAEIAAWLDTPSSKAFGRMRREESESIGQRGGSSKSLKRLSPSSAKAQDSLE